MKIEADSPRVEKCLLAIEKQVKALGAQLHPKMVLSSKNGYLEVFGQCGTKPPGEPLVLIPETALVPVEMLSIGVSKNALIIKEVSKSLSNAQKGIATKMIELYNETEKLAQHQSTSPWIQFYHQPDMLSELLRGRPGAEILERFFTLVKQGDKEKLLIDSYFKTRTGRFTTKQGNFPVMMPIVDSFDHHCEAYGFERAPTKNGEYGVKVMECHPVAGNDACFVRYGIFDSYDTWLAYGFIDDYVPFVRSVPLHIDINKKVRIQVGATIGAKYVDSLPPDLEDLRIFMPNTPSIGSNEITVSHLIIPPPSRPFALKRVLGTLIQTACEDVSIHEIRAMIETAETFIMRENKKFYKRLSRIAEDHQKKGVSQQCIDETIRLCTLQLSKIAAYEMAQRNAG